MEGSMGENVKPVNRFKVWASQLRDSDRGAYAAVFQDMSAQLVRYAKTITRDEASAYDVIQDVFLKLWEIRDRIKPESSLHALLYTMTRNAAINMNRKRAPLVYQQADGEDMFDQALAGKSTASDAVLDANRLAERLNSWIDELPERRREAFVLSRHHDLSHKEISNIMGLSERTVNTHIFLALKHLRTKLDALQNDNITL